MNKTLHPLFFGHECLVFPHSIYLNLSEPHWQSTQHTLSGIMPAFLSVCSLSGRSICLNAVRLLSISAYLTGCLVCFPFLVFSTGLPCIHVFIWFFSKLYVRLPNSPPLCPPVCVWLCVRPPTETDAPTIQQEHALEVRNNGGHWKKMTGRSRSSLIRGNKCSRATVTAATHLLFQLCQKGRWWHYGFHP